MKQKININKNLSDFIAEFPETKDVFELFGVDFETFSSEKIKEVAKDNNIVLNDLVTSLEEKIAEKINFLDNKSLSEVISYIEKTHHAFLWQNLPSTDILFNQIMEMSSNSGDKSLLELKKVFEKLKYNLENHLSSEEDALFSIVRDYEKNPRKKRGNTENINEMIHTLYKEHNETNRILSQMRSLAQDYELPDNASLKLEELFSRLVTIENDLREHMYIENAILLPRISELKL